KSGKVEDAKAVLGEAIEIVACDKQDLKRLNELIEFAGEGAVRKNTLHSACSRNVGIDIMKRLLQLKNADVNATDSSGWRPIHHAASAGNLEAVKLLIASGKCDFKTAPKAGGQTPLELAYESRRMDVAGYLESVHAER